MNVIVGAIVGFAIIPFLVGLAGLVATENPLVGLGCVIVTQAFIGGLLARR